MVSAFEIALLGISHVAVNNRTSPLDQGKTSLDKVVLGMRARHGNKGENYRIIWYGY
jgi:hypothetical protein